LKTLLTMAAVAVGMYLGLLALLWWGQEKLLFHPHPLPAQHRFRVDSDVHEAWVDVPGARLHALHLRLPNPRGVVFFLHGNAGNLDSWFSDADFYRRENMDLFMLDYRGYGKSSGRIASQEQLLADIRAAWAHVQPLYAGKRRVIYGRSLGSGLAAMLAAEVQPELTVLVSPYFSMGELAREHYPWVPSALLRYPLATHEAVARVQGPVLLAHGGRDTLIPPTHSQRLHQVAPHASLLHLPEGGHNDLHLLPAYAEGLSAALQR
jgi:hypothetical protein